MSNIIDKRKEFSYRVLPNGATRVITSLGFSFETDRESNAAFIVKACNEYTGLVEEKEYALAEGKRLSEVATHWQSEYDKLKEQRDSLLEMVSEYYLYLQVESLGNIAKAINSDPKRAQLRNLISDVTGHSNEEVQLKFEKAAQKVKNVLP